MSEIESRTTVGSELPYAEFVTLKGETRLDSGLSLHDIQICYESYGKLNSAKDNALLLFHALSGDSHVAAHNDADEPGWWELSVGSGKDIDTDKFFVICANVLGGCRGTTGPGSIDPETGGIYGSSFPDVTIFDMVRVQKVLLGHLGIEKVAAVVGASMGGMQALAFGTLYPEAAKKIIVIASSHRLTSQALAFDIVARNAILHDENFHDGYYAEKGLVPASGLAIARMIGHITYLSPELMRDKFESSRNTPRDINTNFEKKFSVGSYLGYQGDKFVERFDANSYVTLTNALDCFDLGASIDQLLARFTDNKSSWLFIGFSSDWLFPPEETEKCIEALIKAGIDVSYSLIETKNAHDAFLLPEDQPRYGALINNFLQSDSAAREQLDSETLQEQERLDHQFVTKLIRPGSTVLDLGCGRGTLLSCLKAKGAKRVLGVDIGEESIIDCIKNGVPAVYSDLNQGIPLFHDGEFDYVVLSLTLQSVTDVSRVLSEMLRVGTHGIVSFPNFAYYKLREMYFREGRAPVSSGLLHHNWYNSPNIRFFSIKDFEELCRSMNIEIERGIMLDTETGSEISPDLDPNKYADMAIFVMKRP